MQEGYPASLLSTSLVPTSYEAPGAPGGPDFFIAKEPFQEVFAADSSKKDADVLYATQRPLSGAAYTEKASAAGWTTRPSWFLISEKDHSIPPEVQHFTAERAKATIQTINGSHTAFIAHPRNVAKFISEAASSF